MIVSSSYLGDHTREDIKMDKQLQDIRDLSRAFAKNEIAKDVDLSNYQTDQEPSATTMQGSS